MSAIQQTVGTHLSAFFESTHQKTLTELNVVQDDILTQASSTRWLVPTDLTTIWAMAAVGNGLTRAQLDAPSLQVRRESMEVLPRASGAAFFTLLAPEIDVQAKELALQPTETIAMKNTDAAGADFSKYGLLWWKRPGPLAAMPEGDIRRARATGTTTLTAQKWTSVTLTLDNALEPGLYALVGLLGMTANGLAQRAIITGENYRPGNIVLKGTEAAAADFENSRIRDLMFYDHGHFAHTNVPQIQYLSDVADTAETTFFYVIKIGPPPGQT